MGDLKALICDCCGGHIDRDTLTCISCGTMYAMHNGILEVIHTDYPIKFIKEGVVIPRFMMDSDPDKAMEYSLHQLSTQLAQHIMPLAEYVSEYFPEDCSYRMYMKLGIVDKTKSLKENIRDIWRFLE